MAKKFKKAEKDYILTELVERGADLFRRYGFKKTTITDITKEVGIAQGTFYHFFKSKELLYFTILEKEEEILKRSEEHTSELQSRGNLVCRPLLEKNTRKL